MLPKLLKKSNFFVILLLGWSSLAFTASLNQSDLKPLINELPSEMKEVVLNINPQIIFADKPITFYGSYDGKQNTLTINNLITSDSQKLKRTLFHELAHLFDQHAKNEIQRPLIKDMCIKNALDGKPNDLCRSAEQKLLKISKDPVFQAVFGVRFDQYNSRYFENLIAERSPDHYEYTNERELFAVNFEFFMMDPEYKCRRPVQYNYLSHLFSNFTPFPQATCDQELPFLKMNMAETQLMKINSSRVYRVDYLVADAAKGDVAGGFGHSMLRLVICAPQRKFVNSDCLEDTEFHAIITFRASVADEEISNMKGLTGKYPSNQFIMDYQAIVEEYAQAQFRELTFYPLNLSRNEITNLISQMSQQFWSLERKYYFATNNCASEIVSLFRASLANEKLFLISPYKPLEMADWFKKSGLLSSEKIEVIKSAEFYWQKTLDLISSDKKITFKKFIELDASKRREIYMDAIGKSANLKKTIAVAQLLEFNIHSRLNSRVFSVLGKLIQEKKELDLSKISEILGVRNAGWIFVNTQKDVKSYGIPYENEMPTVKDYLDKRDKVLDKEVENINQIIKRFEQEHSKELDLARKKLQDSKELLQELKAKR